MVERNAFEILGRSWQSITLKRLRLPVLCRGG